MRPDSGTLQLPGGIDVTAAARHPQQAAHRIGGHATNWAAKAPASPWGSELPISNVRIVT
jgi:hypothetical protein